MNPIPWPSLIRELIERGMTQPQIAAACRCGQSTVSDLLNGNTVDPRTSTGLLLLSLHLGEPVYVPPGPTTQPAALDAPVSQAGELDAA